MWTEQSGTSVRPAVASDAAQIAELIALLDHEADRDGIAQRVSALAAAGIPQLVAVQSDQVVGMCGLHRMTAIHRNEPVGRITILVVREESRGFGVGRQLIEVAEACLKEQGCRLIEVTSNDRLVEAHRFYEHVGYERTSKRFAKRLG